MSKDYLVRVQVYCDDPALNFHKRHGRHWLADFGLKFPDAPAGHWMRWESVGHATRKPYRESDDGPVDGALETLVEEEIYARGLYDTDTGVPDPYAAGNVWTEALDEQGRVIPAEITKRANPRTERARFVDWVGEPPPPDWVSQQPLVQGADWTYETVTVPACPCGASAPPFPVGALVVALDALADNGISKISLHGLKLAVRASTS